MKDKFWIYGHFILIILPLLYLHHYGMIQFLHGLSNTPLFKILGVKDSLSLNFEELRDNEREICEREIHQMVFNLCSSCRFICILLTSICKFNLLTLIICCSLAGIKLRLVGIQVVHKTTILEMNIHYDYSFVLRSLSIRFIRFDVCSLQEHLMLLHWS